MTERLSIVAEDYYTSRVNKYLDAGFSHDEAEERADLDLVEWSNPAAYDLTGEEQEFYGLEMAL